MKRERIILGLLYLLILTVFTVDAFGYDYEYSVDATELPFSKTLQIELTGSDNATATLTYDTFLSGPASIELTSGSATLDVLVNVPAGTEAKEYVSHILAMIDDEMHIHSVGIGVTESSLDEVSVSLSQETIEESETLIVSLEGPDDTTATLTFTNGATTHEETVSFSGSKDVTFNPSEEGDYTLTAVFKKSGEEVTITKQLTVVGELSCEISGATKVAQGSEVFYEATITGGDSPYTYAWTLDGAAVGTTQGVNVLFEDLGEKELELSVSDSSDTSTSCEFDVEITNETHDFSVRLFKTDTDNALSGITVTIADESGQTNAAGRAAFSNIFEGTYIVTFEKEGYKTLEKEVTLNEDKSIIIYMEEDETYDEGPQVTLVSPTKSTTLSPGDIDIVFTLDSNNETEKCLLYFSEASENLTVADEYDQPEDGERAFLLTLEGGSWKWRIHCWTASGDTYTPILSLSVGDEAPVEAAPPQEEVPKKEEEKAPEEDLSSLKSEVEQEISTVLSEVQKANEKLSQKEERIKLYISKLNIEDELDKANTQVFAIQKELLKVKLDSTPKDQAKKTFSTIKKRLQELKKKVPQNVALGSSHDYIYQFNESDLEGFNFTFESFVEQVDTNASNKTIEKLFKDITKKQKKIEATTNITEVTVEYLDGSKKPITYIQKSVETKNSPAGQMLIEYIPKSVAKDVSQIKSTTNFTVINPDPVIAIPLSQANDFSYSIEGKVDAKELAKIESFVAPAGLESLPAITGFAAGIGSSAAPLLAILLVVVGVVVPILIMQVYSHDQYNKEGSFVANFKELAPQVISQAQYAASCVVQGEKKVEEFSRLVDEVLERTKKGKKNAALELYPELLHFYEAFSESQKKSMKQKMLTLHYELEVYHAERLLADLTGQAKAGLCATELPAYTELCEVVQHLPTHHKQRIQAQIQVLEMNDKLHQLRGG